MGADQDDVATMLTTHTERLPLVLKTATGEPITEEMRKDLLARSLAGEPLTLQIDIQAFRQKDGEPNRNHIRFRTGLLKKLGASGKGNVFLRDHDQWSQLARGGTILESRMDAEDGGHVLTQTVEVVKPWAVQGVLDRTIDRFSVGWIPTGQVLCTACKANVRECWHWPGEEVAQDDGTVVVVEYEFQGAELIETSAVVVPAVTGTGVKDIRAALGLDNKNRSERDMPTEPQPVSAATPQVDQAALVRAETDRVLGIQRVGKKLGIAADVVNKAIDDNTSLDAFNALAIDAHEAATPQPVRDEGRPSVTAGLDAADKLGASLMAAIMLRANVITRVEQGLSAAKKIGLYNGPVKFEAGYEHRGKTLREMAGMMLAVHNIKTDGLSAKQLVGLAFTSGVGSRLSISGANSTSDFPNLLENVLHKVLLAEYQLTADTWSRFCYQGTVSDFRDHPRLRQGSIQNLEKVNEHGEIRRGRIPDGRKETVSADEYGLIVAITRRAIINDELDAFARIPRQLGRAAARSIESAVYALLAENDGLGPLMGDGLPLYHADHKNISPSAAISVASLDVDRTTFRRQRDESDLDFLDISPAVLLTPLALGSTARTIIGAEFDTDPGAPDRKPNKVQNMVSDIVDNPGLDFNGTSKAETRRYLFGDPMAGNAAIEVSRLAGENGPTLEGRDGWSVAGRELKVIDDWGVHAVDYKTTVTNAGT